MGQQHLQGLFHDPYGLEHPYEPAPTERFPRDPVADQPVELGVETRPAGAAESVGADWSADGPGEKGRTDGVWVRDDDERSYWRVPLPAFRHGQRVTYRLHARQGDQHLSSQAFSFVVAGWCSVEDVVDYQLTPEGLELVCACEDPALQPRLAISFRSSAERIETFNDSHLLRIRLAAKASGVRTADKQEAADEPEQLALLSQPSAASRKSAVLGFGMGQFQVVEETAERIGIATENLRVTVHRRPCRLEVFRSDGTLLIGEVRPPAWLTDGQGRALRVRQTFASPPAEAFCGFGERFNALNQRGNGLDVRVFDQYKNQGRRTYLPVPFCLSSRGYAQYIATHRHVTYDLAASHPDRWSFDAEVGPAGELEYYLIRGEPKRAITAFTELTGKPALPPTWAFGPWMSGNEWNSQARVMEEVRQTIEHDIPATVLVIEAWSDESTFYIWNDAQYTPRPADEPFTYDDFTFPPDGRWPDPKGMIDEFHRLGIRVLLWQIPVMRRPEFTEGLDEPHPQHDLDEAHMLEQRYCVREADGRPYRICPFWFHGGLVLDVTHPEAMEWWLGKRAYLLDELGIDGFKTDGGEHLWGRDLRFADGRQGDELWNLYPNLYVGAYHRFAREKRDGDAITFSRAGFTSAQAHPCHWAGDENSTWAAFRASLLAGLNAGLSGISFWGWDLAGFSGEIPSAELYLRAAAMAAFCPIMQYHSEYNAHREPCRDRTPWNIAERTGEPAVIDVYRQFARLRMRLLPYIEAEAAHCAVTGEPLMRPLFLDWPHDPEAWQIADQYCFGRALLVAPVIEPGVTQRRLYLPHGEWEDFWDRTRLAGSRWITRSAPLDIMPVYRRLDASWPGLAVWPE